MELTALQSVYDALAALLMRHRAVLELHERAIGSQAKDPKPQLHLYGPQAVAIAGRAPQKTYLAGIMQQKNCVSLHFLPLYTHPQHFELSPALAKVLSGKSCLHIKSDNAALLAELEQLLAEGIRLYRDLGWI